MILYQMPRSRSTRAVWALEHAEASYECKTVSLYEGEGRRPPYIDLNPGGKVPTLVDGDQVITESAAIVTHVGERFPASHLVPPLDDPLRSQYFRWCFFVIGELEQPLWTMGKHRFAIPEKYRVPEILETAAWEFRVASKVLSKGLGESAFLLGDTFSGADILAGHTLLWAKSFQVPIEFDNLTAYVDRLKGTPSFQRTRAKEKALLEALG